MKYQLIAAGAALASTAAASNINRRDFGWNVEYVTDVQVVTVVDIVTVVAGALPAINTPAPMTVTAQVPAPQLPSAAATVNSTSLESSFSVAQTSSASSLVTAVSSTPALATPAASSAATEKSAAANQHLASHSSSSEQAQSTSASSAAAQATSSSASSATSSSGKNITTSSLSPKGKKAGLSGYVGIQNMDSFSQLAPYISWYSDYTATTPSSNDVVGVGMLWAASGSGCGSEVSTRVDAFDSLIKAVTPEIMFGFYEPDCYCPDSSSMTVAQGQAAWNSKIAPLKSQGAILGSPSMCKQRDETWLTPFKSNIDADWDVTSVHINVVNITEVKADIEYYASTYGKPIWVSEFACVDGHDTWTPCTDQDQINQFIKDCVEFFEGNDTVVAYGPSNGNGLGNVWPLTTASGELSTTGQTYLNAIKGL